MIRPRVPLADDRPESMTAFAQILETEFEIVGQATSGQEAIALSENLGPDILVLDIEGRQFVSPGISVKR